MRVVVTGGTGTLGRPTVAALVEAGHDVTSTTRRPTRPGEVRFDLESGDGAEAAVAEQEVVVHVASDTARFGKHDLLGTQRLLTAANQAGVGHFVYISIVGCDEIPFLYYERKTEVEHAIERSPVPHSTLRTTQYHEFAALLAGRLSKAYVTLVPSGVRFQALDSVVAAQRLAELAGGDPQGRVEDLGGPEALLLSDMVDQYLSAVGRSRPVFAVPLFGSAYRGFVAGKNLAPNHADHSGRTWQQWLDEVAAGE